MKSKGKKVKALTIPIKKGVGIVTPAKKKPAAKSIVSKKTKKTAGNGKGKVLSTKPANKKQVKKKIKPVKTSRGSLSSKKTSKKKHIPIKPGVGIVTKPKYQKSKIEKAAQRSRKYKHKGKIVAQNVHIAATVICEFLRQNKMKCSYQYIIDKIFYFVNYYMEYAAAPPSLSAKDKFIYGYLKFIYEYYARQESIDAAHKYYEKDLAKRFYLRPIVVKKEYSDTMMALRKHISTVMSKNIYIGLIVYNIFYLANYYFINKKFPARMSQLQAELVAYMDMYDDHFTVQYDDQILRFNTGSIKNELDLSEYIQQYFTGKVTKLRYIDFMAVMDYHLIVIWKARDEYLNNADDDSMTFMIYTMLETLTKTFFVDFHTIDVEGADPDIGLSFIVGEFLHEAHTSSVYLDEVLRNKTGLPIPDED